MPTKITNISGIDYADDVLFNNSTLSNTVLFNGFPVNTETFPSGNNYIWSFYTGSSRELLPPGTPYVEGLAFDESDVVLHDDFSQRITLNEQWSERGWYNPSSSDDYATALGSLAIEPDVVDLMGNKRAWQIETRLGIGDELVSPIVENIFGYLNKITASLDSSAISAVYKQLQIPGDDNNRTFASIVNNTSIDRLGWVNGERAVFPVRLNSSSDIAQPWGNPGGSFINGTKGYAMGGYAREIDYGYTVAHGTPSIGTGPRGGPAPYLSPFVHPTASIVLHTDVNEANKDRFIHCEHGLDTGKFAVVRTPQRVFNYHPEEGVSRKFFSFYWHAHSLSSGIWDNMSLVQQYPVGSPDNENYIATVWATQYNMSGTNTNDYTHPPSGVTYTDRLIYHQTPDIIQVLGNHRVVLQTPPTFIGGIKRSDVGDFNGSAAGFGFFDRFYSAFPEGSGSDWRSKVFEIPDSAFDYGGTIALEHDTSISPQFIDTDIEVGKNKGIYIYVVTSPPTDQFSDLSFCNFQIGEFDNALVPQTILDQLE